MKRARSKEQGARIKKNPRGGRPTDYRARYADDVREFLLYYENATDEDIAKYFSKSVSTINLWKVKHPKFSEALHAGKMRANAKVGSALYNAAVGFETFEEKLDGDGEVVQLRKFVPGDVAAMKLFLTNRGTRHWRDKQEHALSNPDGSNLIPQAEIEASRMVAEMLYEKQQAAEQEKGKPQMGTDQTQIKDGK